VVHGEGPEFKPKYWKKKINKRKAWHLCLHFVPVVLCSEPFSPAATLESRKDRNDGKHLYDKGLNLPLRSSRALKDRPLLQMRMITYDDVAAPWSRGHHLTQVISGITTSLEPRRTRMEIMTNLTYCPLP
jgi:hypothetical protein